jgi:hypothetical protein
MSAQAKRPMIQRAAIRGAVVFVSVMAIYFLMRAFGIESATTPARMGLIAAVGGLVWGGFYFVTASAVERAIARIEKEAGKSSVQ